MVFDYFLKFVFICKLNFVGDWDLKKILPVQCKLTGYDVPPYMRSWINVKKSFADHLHHWPQSQAYLLDYFQILQYGRAHSGIDDCHDLAQVVRELGKHFFPPN